MKCVNGIIIKKNITVHKLQKTENRKIFKKNILKDEKFEQIIQKKGIIKTVYTIVLNKMSKKKEIDFFNRHILPCSKICYDLAKIRKYNIVEAIIAGLLHDFGKYFTKDSKDRHEIIGAKIAENLLNTIKYNGNCLEICNAIKNHRIGSRKKISVLSQIVSDADAISYLKNIDYFKTYLERQVVKKKDIKNLMENKTKDCIAKMSKYGKIYNKKTVFL